MKKKVLHITNIASLYRKSQWGLLLKNPNLDYHFYYGDNSSLGIKTINETEKPFLAHQNQLHKIRNLWIAKKYLIWQIGVISICMRTNAKMVILLGDFVTLSNWIATIVCRLRGVMVVHRGHGMYGDEKGLKLFLRKNYYKLANAHLLYERRAKKIMIEHGFKKEKLHIIFNSLDYGAHKKARERLTQYSKTNIYPFFKKSNLPTLIFVGRLTKVKKLDLLIEAVSHIQNSGIEINLLLVGDGPERANLETLSQQLTKNSIHFYGPCYDDRAIESLMGCADLCVSPGNVGLTAIHSLSYGTPVVTHNNYHNQMPESESIIDKRTGMFFEENNVGDLADKIKVWLASKKDRESLREECYKIIDQYYNPYYQVQVIENLVHKNPALV